MEKIYVIGSVSLENPDISRKVTQQVKEGNSGIQIQMVLLQPLVLCVALCCLSCLSLFYHEVVASAGAMEEDMA